MDVYVTSLFISVIGTTHCNSKANYFVFVFDQKLNMERVKFELSFHDFY